MSLRPPALLTFLICALVAAPVRAQSESTAQPAEVPGILVNGTARDIRTAAGGNTSNIELVPAGRALGVTRPSLSPDLILRYRLRPGEDDTVRQPFLVFGLDETDSPLLLNIFHGQSPLQRACPDCLPSEPGQGGSVPARLIPSLANQSSSFNLDRCKQAARALRIRAQQQPGCFKFSGQRPSSCEAPLAAVGEFEDFTNSCTTAAETVGDANLTQLAALTIDGTGRPFCSALLVSPSLAITAAHCFSTVPVSRARLHAWSAPDQPISVSFEPRVRTAGATALEQSVVVLRLHQPAEGAHDSVCFADPKSQAELQLYGYLAPPDDNGSNWKDETKTGAYACSAMDTPSTRLAPALARGCYRHTCQAFGGFSGSPMFESSAPSGCRTLVVGMHVGAAGQSGALCSGDTTNSALAGHVLQDALASVTDTTNALALPTSEVAR
jgi:trypsin